MSKNNGRRELVVVGGSAGALEALNELLSRLPQDFSAPILLVLHIPNEYPSHLEEILGRAGPLPVKEVRRDERLQPGTVYVAPPDHHLLVEDSRAEVSKGPRENRHRPAIDPLFRTAARAYGPRTIGVILSGTLDDGSSGLMAVKMVGGLTVVQARHEAMNPEMPMRAKHYADAENELPVAEIAELLIAETEKGPTAREARKGEGAMSKEMKREALKAHLKTDANAEKRGEPSAFACPECGGVLWELQEGQLLRFRCRVGHAYTVDSLRTAMTESVEQALWASMRALEEKAALLRRVADRTLPKLSDEYRQEAGGCDRHVETIRRMLAANQKMDDQEEEARGAGSR